MLIRGRVIGLLSIALAAGCAQDKQTPSSFGMQDASIGDAAMDNSDGGSGQAKPLLPNTATEDQLGSASAT